jgi:hypothetical protein
MNSPMPRSAGITVSAVVAIIGSGFTILLGAMMLLGSALISKSGPAANVPVDVGAVLIVEAAIIWAFGAWGLAAGIGLIYLKRWARISILVFAAILVFFTLPAGLVMAFVPLPKSNDPNLPVNFMLLMRVGMVLFYAAFAALGGFWLYFFNKRGVKAQFQAMQTVPESAGDSFLGAAIPAPISSQSTRPLSITIIGWYLLATSALAPLSLLFSSKFFAGTQGVQVPFYFLGFFFVGRGAYPIFILWIAAQIAAAVGLLKLKRWGLFATIGLQSLAVVNGALLLCIPAHRARFQQIMEAMMASMNARRPQSAPFEFPIWIGYVAVFPTISVILWFLITRRHAFTSDAEEVNRQLS